MTVTRTPDRETITVAAVAIGLTTTKIPPVKQNIKYALVQVQTAQVRVTFNGTDPVAATTGYLFAPGDTFEVWGEPDMLKMRAIRETSTSGAMEVEYMGSPA